MRYTTGFVLCAIALSFVLCGCAPVLSVTSLTTIRSNGSFQRSVVYKTNGSGADRAPKAKGRRAIASRAVKFPLGVVLRKPLGWSTLVSEDEEGTILTSTQAFATGVSLNDDLGLLEHRPEAAKPARESFVRNSMNVVQGADGKISYNEVLHWNGPLIKELARPDQALCSTIRPYLTAADRRNPTRLNRVALAIQGTVWDRLFTAPHPFISDALARSEYANYAIARELRPQINAVIGTNCGSDIRGSQRDALTEAIVKRLLSSWKAGQTDLHHTQGLYGLTDELLYRVRFPGKVIATNGELDPDRNEVVWSLYTVAAAHKDVILTATCQAP